MTSAAAPTLRRLIRLALRTSDGIPDSAVEEALSLASDGVTALFHRVLRISGMMNAGIKFGPGDVLAHESAALVMLAEERRIHQDERGDGSGASQSTLSRLKSLPKTNG